MRFQRLAPSWLLALFAVICALSASAQVPQDVTYTGRLVDDLGNPLAGPVDLELRIFDAASAGSLLYSEQHLGVALDATGGFSVQLGLGTSPSGPFDAALFSDVDRWLEVVVGVEVLAPRQIIASVPWALIAEQANELVRDPSAPRFEDCGDGTVADHGTGLQWEKKTGSPGTVVDCSVSPCPDPHDVNNQYTWSDTTTDPDGGAFTDLLARLNGDPAVVDTTLSEGDGDPALEPRPFGTSDTGAWRLPTIGELRTILVGPESAPGQSPVCASAPCIDPDFEALGGPTLPSLYWTASTRADLLTSAWFASFGNGFVGTGTKTFDRAVRAVRAGSCR